MDKDKFIVSYNNIMNDIIIPDEDFIEVINLLKLKRSVNLDFTISTDKSQQQNILKAIYEDVLNFYKIYLGQ
ncbi:hypothetical protein GTH52_06960 [Clostridium tyrobutyricum]|uniref:Uncharacterized protein n=1 Tax=Clostridium tyrobutyricum DIVETGP TaxID=1408889 RepID=W6NH85_CLOTY|nr:hypothetical protein [Clostridium tyrobutyricum]AND84293.1 hypothetical protein CTK_C10320 [Clostridium tyrobutyricum]AND84377.1 hypothetical protein CTK_C11160 [Clostridium tyrobutyricum]ANP69004.1 hypothetical protein BA182_04745 [Clostridium tyrobutyricum]MBR9648757.1 hypothetical protein [Clostridium tyrobutyricum]MBV4435390.1 hypothetical protein [Clostridium tyrobutyricum]